MRLCVDSSVQMESDLGCPGGKARIIHKESDIITAFAINRVRLIQHSSPFKSFDCFEATIPQACGILFSANSVK